MPKRRFLQVDVFSDQPGKGNGLAVVADAEGLSTSEMQAFAAWTNLAETTFLLPPSRPDADYRVRIFTPVKEMQFAGHPTLGSCAAWMRLGNTPKTPGLVRQDCAIGLVDIDLRGAVPAFVAPATKIAPMPAAEKTRLTKAMGLDPSLIKSVVTLENGPSWNLFELRDAQAVLNVDASRVSWPDQAGLCLFGAHPAGAECTYEVRNIAPSSGMSEDPITGSLNAAIAWWLKANDRLDKSCLVAQGTVLDRQGRISYRMNSAGEILIAGAVNILIEGTLDY